jgi:hypothetical protein
LIETLSKENQARALFLVDKSADRIFNSYNRQELIMMLFRADTFTGQSLISSPF